jgi:hypothetical protein
MESLLSLLFFGGLFLFMMYRLSCWIFGIKPSGKDFAKWTILGILLSIFFGK